MTPAQWLRQPIVERCFTDGEYIFKDGSRVRAFGEAVAALTLSGEIMVMLLPTKPYWHSEN